MQLSIMSLAANCVSCGYRLLGDKFCPNCGVKEITLDLTNIMICPKCQILRPSDNSSLAYPPKYARFCGNCGYDYNEGMA